LLPKKEIEGVGGKKKEALVEIIHKTISSNLALKNERNNIYASSSETAGLPVET
jgi:hypothetical protein